ncbi:hypothetical protein M569_10676 [Genlisea aurea]|uniref:Reticulon-like protein n=1 Tax=Genlisea aurea TaxID=192259 RepID=S8CAZ8_9LAMI|nr:hypothetical protein M569_10676 [Genlisea aurea]
MADQPEISEQITTDSVVEQAAGKVFPAEDDSLVAPPPIRTDRSAYRLFGRQKTVHETFGGGKPADIFLWRSKKHSAAFLGGSTLLWILFEILGYHLLTLVCYILIFAIVSLFSWSNATVFLNKRPPHIPDVQLPEEPFIEVVSALRAVINRLLKELRGIASGRDFKKFLQVIGSLWVLSIVGSFFNFLTLAYALSVLFFTVPAVYEKYDDKIDGFAEKGVSEIKRRYAVLDAKYLRKIPRVPLDKKSE